MINTLGVFYGGVINHKERGYYIHPTIHMGLHRSRGEASQEALQKRGYNPGLIDGLFGPRTRHAVRHYGW